MPSARALSQVGVGPSGRQAGEEEVDSKDIEVFYSEELDIVDPNVIQGTVRVEQIVESHPGEGILLKNPRSKVTNDELTMLRYFFQNTTKC